MSTMLSGCLQLQQKLAERRDARREARSLKDAMSRENTLDLHDNTTHKPSSRGSNETPLVATTIQWFYFYDSMQVSAASIKYNFFLLC